MKKKRSSMLGVGFALALAALAGTAPAASFAQSSRVQVTQEQQKATAQNVVAKHQQVKHTAGGLDLIQQGVYGMPPKEYGLRFGNGKSKSGKPNFNRLKHNAKLKRR